MDEYKNVVCPKYYFQKKNSKYDILNHLYFGPNFVLGTALRRFSQCIFFYFSSSTNHGGRHFYPAPPSPPTIKKLPTALSFTINLNSFYAKIGEALTKTPKLSTVSCRLISLKLFSLEQFSIKGFSCTNVKIKF